MRSAAGGELVRVRAGPVQEAGISLNAQGLIDSFDEALACCRLIEVDPAQQREPSTGWLPRLIVQYPLSGDPAIPAMR